MTTKTISLPSASDVAPLFMGDDVTVELANSIINKDYDKTLTVSVIFNSQTGQLFMLDDAPHNQLRFLNNQYPQNHVILADQVHILEPGETKLPLNWYGLRIGAVNGFSQSYLLFSLKSGNFGPIPFCMKLKLSTQLAAIFGKNYSLVETE